MRRVNIGMKVVLKHNKYPDSLLNPENILCKPITVLRISYRGDYFVGRGILLNGRHVSMPASWIDWDLTDRLNDGTFKPRMLKNRKGVYQMIVNNTRWHESLIEALQKDDMEMLNSILDSMLVRRKSVIAKNIPLLYHVSTLEDDSLVDKARTLINQQNANDFFLKCSAFLNQIKEGDLVISLSGFTAGSRPRIGRYFYSKARKCGRIEWDNHPLGQTNLQTTTIIIGNQDFRISDKAIERMKFEWDTNLGAFKKKESKHV